MDLDPARACEDFAGFLDELGRPEEATSVRQRGCDAGQQKCCK